jgi:hypothetical protein
LAFLIVECGVQLPYKVALELTDGDPLFKSLFTVWNNKIQREKQRDAFLAACIFNAHGAKCKPEDFLPKTIQSRKKEEEDLKARIIAFNAAKRQMGQ